MIDPKDYFIELHWPTINLDHLIKRVDENKEALFNPYYNGPSRKYGVLNDWAQKEEDISPIVKQLPISDSMWKYAAIQSALAPGLSIHRDNEHRLVNAMCVIVDEATTCFKVNDTDSYCTRFKIGKWYLFNNYTYHYVQGIKDHRVSLCFNLTIPYGNYKEAKKYLI